jgi:hypothetical protein
MIAHPQSESIMCYVLTLPLHFPILPCLPTHPHTRLLIPRTALLLSLSSLILFLLTPLISSSVLLLSQLILAPYYVLGLIPLTASPSSTPIALTGILQSFSSQPDPTRLMPIHWSIQPFVMNMFALLTTLMVVTDWLSSYLLILSPLSSWISYRSLLIVLFGVSAINSPLLFL